MLSSLFVASTWDTERFNNDYKIKECNFDTTNDYWKFTEKAKAILSNISDLSDRQIKMAEGTTPFPKLHPNASIPSSKYVELPLDIFGPFNRHIVQTKIGNERLSKLNPSASIFVASSISTTLPQHSSNTNDVPS